MDFNFTTNIEKRMPRTGEVFAIDRMTSDYASKHPLDVDGFIESVYQEFAGTEFEETREVLNRLWTAVLSVTSPQGDASLYPNNGGAKRAAAMKVWLMAGNYWKFGFHENDTLPDRIPMTRITRLNDGSWIALFEKDAHLIENGNSCDPLVASGKAERRIENCATATESSSTPELLREKVTTDNTDDIEAARNQSEPRQLDLFGEELEQLRAENERLKAQMEQKTTRSRRQKQGNTNATEQPDYLARALEKEKNIKNENKLLKTLGYLATMTVVLLVIWETGLIIPIGLIGLATSGIIK